MIDKHSLNHFIRTALKEDINTGDITTMSTIPKNTMITGVFVAKRRGVICGLDIAEEVFHYIDETVCFQCDCKDGDLINIGDTIATINGNAMSVLTGERLALNIMQHLSGISTKTKSIVDQLKGFKTKVLDTRKTTPGLRIMEKYAVRMGGGYNHRFSLADGVLIKDNHIKAAGGIKNAISAARNFVPHTLKIEIEVETLDQVKQALAAGADIIMLDNMTNDMMAQAVKLIDSQALVEASGNMDQKEIALVAKTGVDFISVGGLTNAFSPLDISLKFIQCRAG